MDIGPLVGITPPGRKGMAMYEITAIVFLLSLWGFIRSNRDPRSSERPDVMRPDCGIVVMKAETEYGSHPGDGVKLDCEVPQRRYHTADELNTFVLSVNVGDEYGPGGNPRVAIEDPDGKITHIPATIKGSNFICSNFLEGSESLKEGIYTLTAIIDIDGGRNYGAPTQFVVQECLDAPGAYEIRSTNLKGE